MNIKTLQRHTDLPGRHESAEIHVHEGLVVESRISADNGRIVAAKFQRHRRQLVGRYLHHMLADTHRPGEIDKSHQRMPDKIVANLSGITGDDVDHPGRKHLGYFLKRYAGCENGQLRRLHDNCIACH